MHHACHRWWPMSSFVLFVSISFFVFSLQFDNLRAYAICASSGELWLHFINSFNRWCLCPKHIFISFKFFYRDLTIFIHFYVKRKEKKEWKPMTNLQKTHFDIWFHTIRLKMANGWRRNENCDVYLIRIPFCKHFSFGSHCFQKLLCYSCWHLLWGCIVGQNTQHNKIKESFSLTRSMVDNTMKVFWVLQNSEQLRERKIEYANLCVVKTLCSWCLFELFFIVCAFTLT